MTKRTTTFLVAAAAVAIVCASILASAKASGHEAFAQEFPGYPPQNTTSVTGTATAMVSPDLLVIQLGVDTESKSAQDAVAQNALAMNATATALEKLGITSDEIGTANFQIQPDYNNTGPYPPYNQYKSELVGYKVSNTLLVKTSNLGIAGSLLDAAVSSGANRVDSVSFELSPLKQQSVQNSLIDEAILDAQSKAQKALTPLGQKIEGVKSVSLSVPMMPGMPLYSANKLGLASEAPTPIFAANQEITTSVDVVFLIGPR